MPRLRPSLFWRAGQISPLAAKLLRACRDLPSSLNELRWIREHLSLSPLTTSVNAENPKALLRLQQLCERRAKGVPLQYVLGNQPFGNLEIKCRPGVLIPRPETEAYTVELARIILAERRSRTQPSSSGEGTQQTSMNVVDFCSGSGCIALQLYSSLQPTCPSLRVLGLDISPKAISLARENLRHNIHLNKLPHHNTQQSTHFRQADLFSEDHIEKTLTDQKWDVMISNPPYISHKFFAQQTSRSVRNYEPKLALVPGRHLQKHPDHLGMGARYNCAPEDVFYARLLEIAKTLKPRRILLEVGDEEQAVRVVTIVCQDAMLSRLYTDVEIWRDEPHPAFQRRRIGSSGVGGESEGGPGRGRQIRIRGSGEGRSVYLCQGDE
ncbi:S-adenosyl-L-methionine-dependent methyltransferase [Bombardia bombarda]|uniref:S-adenosyl-L-methionine-dependent methyltransferase n=1 Tax=Bombardia bombarda TaxID=252184 RepID=A0AA39XLV4_9PEZI|nr:S-adenosyl-L-methionine-dependent methyltransferase [Bombardia bombarda]